MGMKNNKSKYVRMSTADFNAILGLLMEDKSKPKVSFAKFGKEYESNMFGIAQ